MQSLAKGHIRILNFDDSLISQKALLSGYTASIMNLKHYGSKIRYWSSLKDLDDISNLLQDDDKNTVTFTGSGDYHHVSYSLIKKFKEPISLVIFDNHPDWDMLGPKSCCGCWVNLILKMPNVLKIVHLGASACDLMTKNIQTANTPSLQEGRVEIYPFVKGPSYVFLKRLKNVTCADVSSNFLFSRINWRSLADVDMQKFAEDIIKRLPVKDTYISIDKDCLKSEYAVTNWENGQFDLEDFLKMLGVFNKKTNIVGCDICGEYSKTPQVTGLIKRTLSYLDYPRQDNYPPQDVINAINGKTNLAILKALFSPSP